jgi:hypothetical protein
MFFLWLAIQDRCWTAELRWLHGLADDDACALCSHAPETIDHLLVDCVVSRELWFKVLRRLDWHGLVPQQGARFIELWLRSHRRVARPRQRAFDSLVALVSRLIWLYRNDRVFQGVSLTVEELLHRVSMVSENWCVVKLVARSDLFGV